MGYYRRYWTPDDAFVLSTPGFAQVMSRRRYMTIYRALRLYDADVEKAEGASDPESPNYDKLHKCRKFLETIYHNFNSTRAPRRQLAIDEQVTKVFSSPPYEYPHPPKCSPTLVTGVTEWLGRNIRARFEQGSGWD